MSKQTNILFWMDFNENHLCFVHSSVLKSLIILERSHANQKINDRKLVFHFQFRPKLICSWSPVFLISFPFRMRYEFIVYDLMSTVSYKWNTPRLSKVIFFAYVIDLELQCSHEFRCGNFNMNSTFVQQIYRNKKKIWFFFHFSTFLFYSISTSDIEPYWNSWITTYTHTNV